MNTSPKILAASIALGALSTAHLCANDFDWPQWRGPDRSDTSKETGLLKAWPAGGPKQVWLFENAGNGYSGPAIVQGKFFSWRERGSTHPRRQHRQGTADGETGSRARQ